MPCRARSGFPAPGSTTRNTRCGTSVRAKTRCCICPSAGRWRPCRGPSWRARCACSPRACARSALRPAIASSPICRIRPKPSSPCSRPRASARCGRVVGPTSAHAACSIAIRSSRPSSCSASTATATAASPSTGAPRSARSSAQLPTLAHVIHLPYLDRGRSHADHAGRAALVGRARGSRSRPRGVPVRAGAVRASVVDPVLVRHHRAAQADHPLPRRHHPRAAEAVSLPHGHARPPAHVLLHHHRLDDVELPRQQPDRRRRARALRRQPGVARRPICSGSWPTTPARICSAPAPATRACSRRRASCPGSASRSTRSKPSSWRARRSPPTARTGSIENVKQDLWAHSGSGGTDICTGLVGGVVNLPIYAGEIQARQLGVAAYAFDEQGKTLVDQVGELVLTEPMPSMPVGFWGDTRRQPLSRVVLRSVPGRLASRRLLPRQRARRLLRARPLRRDAQSPRRAHRHRRGLSLAARRAGGRRLADRQSGSARRTVLHAAVREDQGRRAARRGHRRSDPRADPRASTRRATSRTRSFRSTPSPTR